MNGKTPRFEARIEGHKIAKRDVANRHVIEAVRELCFLESLMANVRVGIEHFGDSRGERVDFNAGHLGVAMHFLRHQADKMPDAAGRFENAAALKAKAL